MCILFFAALLLLALWLVTATSVSSDVVLATVYTASAAAGKVTQECAKHIEQYSSSSSSKAPPSLGVASVACEFSSDIFKSVSCEYNVGHVFHINRESCRMAQDNILPHPPLTFHADICESIQSRKEINASKFSPSVERMKINEKKNICCIVHRPRSG